MPKTIEHHPLCKNPKCRGTCITTQEPATGYSEHVKQGHKQLAISAFNAGYTAGQTEPVGVIDHYYKKELQQFLDSLGLGE